MDVYYVSKLFKDRNTNLLDMSYDSIEHNDNKQMESVYTTMMPSHFSSNDYVVLNIRSKTNNFIDILLTINDEVIYEGKKRKQYQIVDNYSKYKIKFGNYNIICKRYINDNINDNLDNCDAIKL